jgi:hypothetical protein
MSTADRRGLGWLSYLAAAAAISVGSWTAGCGGDDGGSPEPVHRAQRASNSAGISVAEKRAASRRLASELGVSAARVKRLQGGQGFAASDVRPGEIVPGGPGPFFSSDVIWPIRNGWQASDRRSYTGVDAGVNPADHSVGELGILRQDFVKGTQTQHVVDVPGAGALRITDAPLGTGVATWAQKSGNLRFVGTRGVRGTLHLGDDTVSIERSGRSR